MARMGLGKKWRCLFANDFNPSKARTYRANWGSNHFHEGDVAKIKPFDLPGVADLAWASFPCQDLSLAGAGAGLNGERSGTFWPFWRLIQGLDKEDRAPRMIVLENVYGALTSNEGKDFAAIGEALTKGGYKFGAVVIDAALFVPQSRQRLFIIGLSQEMEVPKSIESLFPIHSWHPSALMKAHRKLSKSAQKNWIWWNIKKPPKRTIQFSDLIEENPQSVRWHTPEETHQLLNMMSEVNAAKVEEAKKSGRRMVGGIYKRTRHGIQRAEVRFDGVSGCLRTPAGGSSRQSILVVKGKNIRSRLLSTREAARLMGLPDDYKLPDRYNDAYHLAGDGVVIPVVRHITSNILAPVLSAYTINPSKKVA